MPSTLRKLSDGTVAQGVVLLSGSGGIGVDFSDSVALDPFGRLRVSSPTTLFDSQQEYGLDTLRLWDCSANGVAATPSSNGSAVSGSNSIGPRDVNTRLTPIVVSSTNGHYSILQSRQYIRYIPGKGHTVLMTGIFASGLGYSAKICIRSSTSGSPVVESAAQSAWNIDKFDGAGPSGITLDLTKTQILFINAQWLGVGRVIVGFDVNGVLYPAHQFFHANSFTAPYTQSFNLPVRAENRNTGAAESTARFGYFDGANGVYLETARPVAGGTVYFCCCSVQSEGGEESRGFPNSSPTGISTIAVTTRRPVLSLRQKVTYNGITNRSHIDDIEYIVRASGNDALVEVIIGGVLTGSSFQSVSSNSTAEYDVSATAISGGEALIKGFAISGGGQTALMSGGIVDIRSPLVMSQIDGALTNQVPVSIVCTSFTGTSNITSVMNWHEQVV